MWKLWAAALALSFDFKSNISGGYNNLFNKFYAPLVESKQLSFGRSLAIDGADFNEIVFRSGKQASLY